MRIWITCFSLGLLSCGLLGQSCCNDSSSIPGSDFSIQLTPSDAITGPGEYLVLLATVEDVLGTGPVAVTVECPGAQATIDPVEIEAGQVAEITLIPAADPPPAAVAASKAGAQIGEEPSWYLTPVVTGQRGGVQHAASASIGVIQNWDDTIEAEAVAERDRIIPWLAASHPELGIDGSTVWTPSMPNPLLIVTHYLYFSDEWEMHVAWHVMIPPYDWVKYELRRRGEESAYSTGFMVDSRSAEPPQDPHTLTPENTLWR